MRQDERAAAVEQRRPIVMAARCRAILATRALTISSSDGILRPMIEARIRASIEAYVAACNVHDAAQRMRLIEQACAEDLLMRTPGNACSGWR